MNIEEILSLPKDQWLEELKVDPVTRNIANNIKYYNGEHPILTDPSRADYSIDKWEIDEQTGQPKTNPVTGAKIKGSSETVKRTRLVLDYQVQIVDTAVGMCVGAPVTLTLNSSDENGHEDAFKLFVDQWRNKARLDSFNMTMSRALFKESKCAEVLFIKPEDENKDIKIKLLSKENGDDIWAHFDDDGSMDALTRIFIKRAVIEGKAEDVEVTQIWTAKTLYEKIGDGDFVETKNPYDKIPIVYYDQKKPEWEIVKDLISKQELVRSRNSDVNKRVGNPNVVVQGKLTTMPEVEQDVKVFTAEPTTDADGKTVQSDVKYLQLDGAHEAINDEIEQDKQDMYKLTWPDLSFLRDSIKTGTLSGTAIKLMFTDAFVKIGNKREIYEDFSRRISVMKRMLAVSTGQKVFDELNISVEFNSILPENVSEMTDTLAVAVNAGITSQEQAVNSSSLNAGNPNVLDQIKENEGLEAGIA
jgi:SPP1 family phage portal protein